MSIDRRPGFIDDPGFDSTVLWPDWSTSSVVGDPGIDGGSSTNLWPEPSSIDGYGSMFGPSKLMFGSNHVGCTGLDIGSPIPVNHWSDPVDGPGFGAGAFTLPVDAWPGSDGAGAFASLIDTWPGSGGAEPDGTCSTDDFSGGTNQFSMN